MQIRLVSTKGEFQLILAIPYFPKPDSPQSKVAGARVGVAVEIGVGEGRGREAFLKSPLALASCIERVLNLYRSVNNLRLVSFGGSSANEECQSPEDQWRFPQPSPSSPGGFSNKPPCGASVAIPSEDSKEM